MVDVAADADRLAAQLLGRGVLRISDHPGGRRCRTAQDVVSARVAARGIRQTEVEQGRAHGLGPLETHEDVGRGDVAMDQADGVGRFQGAEDRHADAADGRGTERTVGEYVLGERRSLQPFLGDPRDRDRTVLEGADIDHLDDPRVGHRGGAPGLDEEGLAQSLALGQVRMQQLDGHRAIQERVRGREHRCRPTRAEESLEAEPAGDEARTRRHDDPAQDRTRLGATITGCSSRRGCVARKRCRC
ncbi:hypothetical protein SRABI128_04600 [Microbacterium sp. Bi128]|nr:hypothetical protein SRABI128_04600 [Microbacterium sp. Bi128]